MEHSGNSTGDEGSAESPVIIPESVFDGDPGVIATLTNGIFQETARTLAGLKLVENQLALGAMKWATAAQSTRRSLNLPISVQSNSLPD